jgi:hypothetical protein
VEDLVLGVAEIHQAEPEKIILIDGVDRDLFLSGIVDVPFRVMEIPHVYLTPRSEERIQAPADLVAKFVLPEQPALRALEENRAVVYEVAGSTLRNITNRYRLAAETWKAETPRFINLGDSVFDNYLGSGWSQSRDGTRYMKGAGTLHVGVPRAVSDRLYIGVFCVRDFRLGLRVNGVAVPANLERRDFDLSEFAAKLPASVIGEKELEIRLSADAREPLKFGFVEVR